MNMHVDVVTAVHSPYARFLPDVWASLQDQTHDDWTWFIAIDGDDDEIRTALHECEAAADPRVRIITTGVQQGPAVARNAALDKCTGPFLQNLDADDQLEPTALETLLTAFARYPSAGFAVGQARDLVGTELHKFKLPIAPGLLERGKVIDHWDHEFGDYRLPVHPAGAMWRLDLVLLAGFWQALWGMEDTGLLMSGSALAEGILVEDETLRYRKHPGQHSNEKPKNSGGGVRNEQDVNLIKLIEGQVSLILKRVKLLRSWPQWYPVELTL
jgi:glycosyltransferase involved in cell wall biosynthesis